MWHIRLRERERETNEQELKNLDGAQRTNSWKKAQIQYLRIQTNARIPRRQDMTPIASLIASLPLQQIKRQSNRPTKCGKMLAVGYKKMFFNSTTPRKVCHKITKANLKWLILKDGLTHPLKPILKKMACKLWPYNPLKLSHLPPSACRPISWKSPQLKNQSNPSFVNGIFFWGRELKSTPSSKFILFL